MPQPPDQKNVTAPKPKTGNPRQKKSRPAQRKTSAGLAGAQLNYIGIVILVIGFAAFIAVLYFGYVRFFYNAPAYDPNETPRAIDTPFDNEPSQSAPRPDQDIRELGRATMRDMSGKWRAKYGVNTVDLGMNENGEYAITVYLDARGYERLFSKGVATYDEEEGILRLKPSYDPMPIVEGVDYSALNYNPYEVVILFNERTGNLYWVPGSMVGRRGGLHPLFVRLGRRDNYIEWIRPR